jgi:6-phosphogluconolactonase/glucosamine-6-phosphate isomerase/deaminase
MQISKFLKHPKVDPFLPRITMNLSLILSSELIILLVKGKAKHKRSYEASKNDKNYPIHYLIKK